MALGKRMARPYFQQRRDADNVRAFLYRAADRTCNAFDINCRRESFLQLGRESPVVLNEIRQGRYGVALTTAPVAFGPIPKLL